MNTNLGFVSRLFVIGAVVGALAATARAGSYSSSARGTSAAAFLKIPVGARAAGMGGAVTAVTGDPAVLAGNPAGMASSEKRQVLLAHSPSPEGTASSNAYFVHPFTQGAVGVGLTYFSAGSIDETEPTAGATVGTFHPSDWAATVGLARNFRGWDLGLAVKAVQTKIIESDSTLAFDGGILTPKLWGERWRFGASLLNSGGSLSLGETARPLPVQMAVGVAYSPNDRWTLAGDVKFPRDNDPFLCVGGEGIYPVGAEWRLAGRAGWEGSMDTELGDGSGLNAGLGIAKGAMGVDYAFSPMGDLGEAHRISVTFSF
jgi:hypothetical protein